jgi:hypothetical protein
MFERFTEKARGVVFFARYEASQYGSPYIETEHFLLGLLREDANIARLLPELPPLDELRREIAKYIEPRERISTSVEVPLSAECKRILNSAAKVAEQLGHKHIGTEHLLLATLREKDSVAAVILRADKVDLEKMRERVRNLPPSSSVASSLGAALLLHKKSSEIEKQVFEAFMKCLRSEDCTNLGACFGKNATYIDSRGTLWSGREEIMAKRELLLAPFAKRKSTYHVEKEDGVNGVLWVGTILWEGIQLQPSTLPELFRMTLVFGNDAGEWVIFLLQVSYVAESKAGKTAAS